MKYSLDRFEGEFAILIDDNQEKIEIKKEYLPTDVKEGDILIYNNGNYIIDEIETAKRKETTVSKFNKLFRR